MTLPEGAREIFEGGQEAEKPEVMEQAREIYERGAEPVETQEEQPQEQQTTLEQARTLVDGETPVETRETPANEPVNDDLSRYQLDLEKRASQQDRYFNSPEFYHLQATNPGLAERQMQQASGERAQMMKQHKQVLGKRVQAGLESTFESKAEFSEMVDHYRRSGVPPEIIRQSLMGGEGKAMREHYMQTRRPAKTAGFNKGGGLLDVGEAFAQAEKSVKPRRTSDGRMDRQSTLRVASAALKSLGRGRKQPLRKKR